MSSLIIGSSFSGMIGLGISYGNEFTNMGGRYAMLTFIGMQFTGAVIVKLTGLLMKTYSYDWSVFVLYARTCIADEIIAHTWSKESENAKTSQ